MTYIFSCIKTSWVTSLLVGPHAKKLVWAGTGLDLEKGAGSVRASLAVSGVQHRLT